MNNKNTNFKAFLVSLLIFIISYLIFMSINLNKHYIMTEDIMKEINELQNQIANQEENTSASLYD